jgi:hypothetical protein
MTEVDARRDPEFYFSFRTFQVSSVHPISPHPLKTVWKVEGTLFRVPRHLFLFPNANIQPVPQGTDNEDDLVILGDDIKKEEFRQLLRAVYQRYASRDSCHPRPHEHSCFNASNRHYNTPEVLTTDQWQAVFKLSQTFGLDDLRVKAAYNLKDMFFNGDPVEGLLRAKENSLDDWIEPLIEKIVQTKKDLTEEEVGKMGITLAMRVARAQGAAANRGRKGKR